MLATLRSASLRIGLGAVTLVGLAITFTGCGGGAPKAPAAQAPSAAAPSQKPAEPPSGTPAAQAEAPLPPSAAETALPEALRGVLYKPFTGDLDQMVERRLIRVGVTYNRTFYFVDKGVQRGVAYEYVRLFEEELNKKLNTGNMKVFVFFVPLPRDMLGTALVNGEIDLAIAQITVRPELQKLVDFTNPTRTNVNEVVVTGPGAPAIASVGDLSGQEVFVRKGGKYDESLQALNARLTTQGKPPVVVQAAPPYLEDDDVLEMVNAGLIKITVVDDYLAKFWNKVFTQLTVHDTVTLRTGGNLAVAVRRNSPKLASALNGFIAKYGLGTAFGGMMEKRYLVSTRYAKNATSEAERKKFMALVALFQKYSDQYKLDYLLMAAQGFQESGLNQDAKSQVGAIGVMQVMPETGKDLKVGDIQQLEPNIHAGVKYIRFMEDQFYKDAPMDDLNKGLFTFASYNAGPGRIQQLRKEAEKRGLNPNVWFGNVEQIASERIGRETVTYVSNIYKYYVAYRLVAEERERRAAAKAALKPALK